MSRRLLSLLLPRAGAPLSSVTSYLHNCRFINGGTRPWTGQRRRPEERNEEFEGDLEDEGDVEDKLQALIDKERKKQKMVKYHIMKRKMSPKGAPQRKLTWEAIEQIRYLKEQQPEEWTVARLAEGFSVSCDVILRVLKSKFDPTPERKAKQDGKIMIRLSEQGLLPGAKQDTLKLTESKTTTAAAAAALLPHGGGERALIPAANQNLTIQREASRSMVKNAPVLSTQQLSVGVSQDATETTEDDTPSSTAFTPEEEEEEWDGFVFTEEQIIEFMELEMKKPAPAVQVGSEFFNAEGNFLYRL